MKDQRFTLQYLEGEELPIPIPEGFDTIEEATGWCYRNDVPYDIVQITEWDLTNYDAMNVPNIVASVNLGVAIADRVIGLSRYQTY